MDYASVYSKYGEKVFHLFLCGSGGLLDLITRPCGRGHLALDPSHYNEKGPRPSDRGHRHSHAGACDLMMFYNLEASPP